MERRAAHINVGGTWQRHCYRVVAALWMSSGRWDIEHLKKSHEKHSPLRADKGILEEGYGSGYWDE